MPIKGWKKLSEVRYESTIQPGHIILITKKHLHLPLYDGWGVKFIVSRGYVVVPDQDTHVKYAGKPNYSWTELTKKDATKAAMKWMREHPRGG